MSFSMFRVEYEIKHSNRNGQPITVEKDSKLERLLAKLANVSAGTAKKYFPGHVDYLTGFHDTEDEGRWMFSFIDRHGNIQHEEHVLDKEGFDKMTAELGQFRPNMGSARVWHVSFHPVPRQQVMRSADVSGCSRSSSAKRTLRMKSDPRKKKRRVNPMRIQHPLQQPLSLVKID